MGRRVETPRRLLKLGVIARLESVSVRTVQRRIENNEYDEVSYPTPTDVRIPAWAVRKHQDERTVRVKP